MLYVTEVNRCWVALLTEPRGQPDPMSPPGDIGDAWGCLQHKYFPIRVLDEGGAELTTVRNPDERQRQRAGYLEEKFIDPRRGHGPHHSPIPAVVTSQI